MKIDHTNTMRITCPYCGYEVFNSCDRSDQGQIECLCGNTYDYQREILVSYTTYVKEVEE